ncbi:4a-hydroxytetrahydrobiopterin dehydratase [Pelagibacterium xiamenense]|uniref:4a-hydroxytetrahydrobiopterin dehydratase n=1 Tax=Pelagibacterium xiamenense TaxID=2901140 RepID=UPI001E452B78|nr:4a-hydroxytetrahydrobiopterin dehydratase [Pelagibacterium xiamenense]MCD7058331.1 4a-hydroxytetrahydrobiopterin dehydratase [Pelagibacterium xiamenense]
MSEDTSGILTGTALEEHLHECPGWSETPGPAIAKSFKFQSFVEAFAFMTQVALLAEKAGHHPDWSNSYNRVDIALSTHDKGGITQNDIALARKINALVSG